MRQNKRTLRVLMPSPAINRNILLFDDYMRMKNVKEYNAVVGYQNKEIIQEAQIAKNIEKFVENTNPLDVLGTVAEKYMLEPENSQLLEDFLKYEPGGRSQLFKLLKLFLGKDIASQIDIEKIEKMFLKTPEAPPTRAEISKSEEPVVTIDAEKSPEIIPSPLTPAGEEKLIEYGASQEGKDLMEKMSAAHEKEKKVRYKDLPEEKKRLREVKSGPRGESFLESEYGKDDAPEEAPPKSSPELEEKKASMLEEARKNPREEQQFKNLINDLYEFEEDDRKKIIKEMKDYIKNADPDSDNRVFIYRRIIEEYENPTTPTSK